MRAVLILASVVLAPAAAGQAHQFRYNPSLGLTVNMYTEVRSVTTVNGLPRLPDGTRIESEARIFGRQRVLGTAPDGSGRRVRVSLDSARVRVRQGDAAWNEGQAPPFAGTSADVVISERFRLSGVESASAEQSAALQSLTAWVGNLTFAFPEAPVSVGGRFATEAQVAYVVTLGDETGMPVEEVLLGDLSLVLDSLVARGGDTLVYLGVAGQFTPRELEAAAEDEAASATFRGRFVGTMVWSEGWDAFVTAAVRVHVVGEMRRETAAGQIVATVEWDTTISHRVRP